MPIFCFKCKYLVVVFLLSRNTSNMCWWFQIVCREKWTHKEVTRCQRWRQLWVMTSCSRLLQRSQLMLWRGRGRLCTWVVTQCQTVVYAASIIIITVDITTMISVTRSVCTQRHSCRTALCYSSDIYNCNVIVITVNTSWQWRQWWCRRQWHWTRYSGHVITSRMTLPQCTVGRLFSSSLTCLVQRVRQMLQLWTLLLINESTVQCRYSNGCYDDNVSQDVSSTTGSSISFSSFIPPVRQRTESEALIERCVWTKRLSPFSAFIVWKKSAM